MDLQTALAEIKRGAEEILIEDELVEKLIFLADNENESKEIGKRGYQFARCNFDKNILSERMIKAIENIKN